MVAKQIEGQMGDRERDIRILTELCGWKPALPESTLLESPDGNYWHALPRLSESLDECFRWIVPALSAQGWLCAVENTDDTDRFVADLFTEALTGHEGYRHVDREADTPAKAVVAAVCAYLDGEGK